MEKVFRCSEKLNIGNTAKVGKIILTPPFGGNSGSDLSASGGNAVRE
ncbi:MAG: hypothetical protein AB7V36_12315 [Bacteroidales bacterium]